jgi:hypothetical protein
MQTCLSDMKKILDDAGQHFFLVCGTLLGQQRENDFIKYDTDIDIGILASKYNQNIITLITQSSLFKIENILGKESDSLELKFRHKNGIPIDIFLFYKIKDFYYYSASFCGLCDFKPEKYCKMGNHIRGFSIVKFKNELYNIPANCNEFLTEWYGNWRIPKNFDYFQGLDGEYKNLIN